MAHHVEYRLRVNTAKSTVWAALEDFGGVTDYHFSVKNAPMLSANRSGLGATRRCEFYDNTSVVEKIVSFDDGNGYKIALSEFSMPLKSLMAEMRVTAVNDDVCDVTMALDYVVKYGPVGKLMGHFMMRPMMTKMIKKVLSGLAYHAVTGKNIADTPPTEVEMQGVLVSK